MFTVNVTPVNDPPTLDLINDPASILEDAGDAIDQLSGITFWPERKDYVSITATSAILGWSPINRYLHQSNPAAVLSYKPLANQYERQRSR